MDLLSVGLIVAMGVLCVAISWLSYERGYIAGRRETIQRGVASHQGWYEQGLRDGDKAWKAAFAATPSLRDVRAQREAEMMGVGNGL